MERRILFNAVDGFGAEQWDCIPFQFAPGCSCQYQNLFLGVGGLLAGGGLAAGVRGGLEGPKVALENANGDGGQTSTKYAGLSAAPIRYFDGLVDLNGIDMTSDAYGKLWGQARSYSEATIRGPMGNHWVVTDLPFVVDDDGMAIASSTGTDNRLFIDAGSGIYVPSTLLNAHDTLTEAYVGDDRYYVLTDSQGGKTTYQESGPDITAPGQFQSYTDSQGNTVAVTERDFDGQPTKVQRSSGSNVEEWDYHYNTTLWEYLSGHYQELIDKVTLRRSTDGGSTFNEIQETDYGYYDGTTSGGSMGDLASAAVKDAAGNVINQTDYRYWKSGETAYAPEELADSPSTVYQQPGEIKGVFDQAAIARAEAAGYDPTTATDSNVLPFATNSFIYYGDNFNGEWHVYQETAAGFGASAEGGSGTFTYRYSSVNHDPVGGPNWDYLKTTETLPDGSSNVIYTGAGGEAALKLTADASGNITSAEYFVYDSEERLIWDVTPSAISLPSGLNSSDLSPLENSRNLLGYDYDGDTGHYQYIQQNAGLINVTDYYGSTSGTISDTVAGGVADYIQDAAVMQGTDGTPVVTEAKTYYKRSDSDGTTIYPLATDTVYGNDGLADPRTTSDSYTWATGTLRMTSLTVTLPTISSTQNGPGSADQTTTVFDTFGRPVWTKDGDGFIDYTEYDGTGVVNRTIQNVNTSNTNDAFVNLPSGADR